MVVKRRARRNYQFCWTRNGRRELPDRWTNHNHSTCAAEHWRRYHWNVELDGGAMRRKQPTHLDRLRCRPRHGDSYEHASRNQLWLGRRMYRKFRAKFHGHPYGGSGSGKCLRWMVCQLHARHQQHLLADDDGQRHGGCHLQPTIMVKGLRPALRPRLPCLPMDMSAAHNCRMRTETTGPSHTPHWMAGQHRHRVQWKEEMNLCFAS